MNRTADFFDSWMKSQEQMVADWLEAANKLPQTLWGMNVFKNGSEHPGNGFFSLYSSWADEMVNTIISMQGMNADIIKDTLTKMTGSSNIYMKFYEMWLPIFKAVQERVTDVDFYKQLLDPSKYKEVVDKIFGLSPNAISEFIDEATRLSEVILHSFREFGMPWVKAARDNAGIMPGLLEGKPDTLLNMFHNLFTAFDETVGKVFHIPAVGKDREKIELLMRGFDDMAVLLSRLTEYQNWIYSTGLRAMEKVLEDLAGKIRKGEEIKTFHELFDLWADINEREYFEVFRTEGFSKMQGRLLEASLSVRRRYHKLMELYLFDFPVALRSEMDDLYRTVYDLKRKVRSLEEQRSRPESAA